MNRRAWVRLDNASNIFLAARTEVDTKVFRMIVEMDHEVDPLLLQAALDTTFDRYPLYHASLRRGVFWYYLQDTDLRPRVQEDTLSPCSAIYRPDRLQLLFRVIHHRRRIILEVFHVLSDGGGALRFLTDLTEEYANLRDPAAASDADPRWLAEGMAPDTLQDVPRIPRVEDPADTSRALVTDSFTRYFHRRRKDAREGEVDAEGPGAGATADGTEGRRAAPSTGRRAAVGRDLGGPRRRPGRRPTAVLRPTGTRTPDHRTHVVEVSMPVDGILGLARAERISLTTYLTALFFAAVREASGAPDRARTLAASVPVDLRQVFPSTSPRNFFATARVSHTYGEGDDDLGTVGRALEVQLREQVSTEALEARLRFLLRLERRPWARIVPRQLKDLMLSGANHLSNRGLTVAISNMGRITLPEPASSHAGRTYLQVSAARPQFGSMTHAGLLTVSFTSPFVEADHVRVFVRHLTARGIPVTVAASRTTEAEIAEGRG